MPGLARFSRGPCALPDAIRTRLATAEIHDSRFPELVPGWRISDRAQDPMNLCFARKSPAQDLPPDSAT